MSEELKKEVEELRTRMTFLEKVYAAQMNANALGTEAPKPEPALNPVDRQRLKHLESFLGDVTAMFAMQGMPGQFSWVPLNIQEDQIKRVRKMVEQLNNEPLATTARRAHQEYQKQEMLKQMNTSKIVWKHEVDELAGVKAEAQKELERLRLERRAFGGLDEQRIKEYCGPTMPGIDGK